MEELIDSSGNIPTMRWVRLLCCSCVLIVLCLLGSNSVHADLESMQVPSSPLKHDQLILQTRQCTAALQRLICDFDVTSSIAERVTIVLSAAKLVMSNRTSVNGFYFVHLLQEKNEIKLAIPARGKQIFSVRFPVSPDQIDPSHLVLLITHGSASWLFKDYSLPLRTLR